MSGVFGGSAGGLKLLATASASNSASVEFTELIDSSFNQYLFSLTGIKPATDGANINITMSDDGGASYDTTNYEYAAYETASNASSMTLQTSNSTPSIRCGFKGIGNLSNEHGNMVMYLNQPSNGALYTSVHGMLDINANDSTSLCVNFSGQNDFARAINAIKFAMNTGNISSGEFAMYGVKS